MNYVRRLVDVIGRKLGLATGATEENPLTESESLWNQLVAAKGCIKCNKLPKGFIEGPSGGMSTNVFCSQCGQGYNLTPIAQWAELIHKDEKYVVREEP
jgi:hypothetical protein